MNWEENGKLNRGGADELCVAGVLQSSLDEILAPGRTRVFRGRLQRASVESQSAVNHHAIVIPGDQDDTLAACTNACMYVCMYVCMYARMHLRTYACMHVCKYRGEQLK